MNNRIAGFLSTIAAALGCASLYAIDVSTVSELTTAIGDSSVSEIVLLAGGSPYKISSQLSVSRAVTIRGETGDPADVVVDGQLQCRVFDLDHADAVVRDLTIYRGKNANLAQHGGGVRINANGGKVENCIFDACQLHHNTAPYGGAAAYIGAIGIVSNCVIRNSTVGANSDCSRGVGVYVNGGTLANCLVTGCSRTGYAEHNQGNGAVYLASGTVKNCTITGNVLSDSALQVMDNAGTYVIDTISWGNTAKWMTGSDAPNANVAGSKPQITGLFTANPSLNADYTLSPASPCIGAGVNGGDLGWKPFDSSKNQLGISVSAENGVDSLAVTARVVGSGAYAAISSVTWDGLSETGTPITHTYGPGIHTLSAQVTLEDDSVVPVSLTGKITVKSTGRLTVDANHSFDDLFPIAGDGSVLYVPNGTRQLAEGAYYINDSIRIEGESRDGTVLKRGNSGRFFCILNPAAEICTITLDGVSTSQSFAGEGAGVWMKSGGTVSNCVVKSCAVAASKGAGGILMENAGALVTHSLIMGNMAGSNTGKGAGIYLTRGTVADSLVISNSTFSTTDADLLGGGIYMGTSTADAKVINCTVAKNSAYSGGGIYRAGGAGYVYNTVVYGNTVNAAGVEFASVSSTDRNTDVAVMNCASPTGVGSAAQTLTAAPYVLPYYELDGSISGQLIDTGDSSLTNSLADFAGRSRIFGSSVDIGCYEYSQTSVAVGFTVDKTESTGRDDFTFTAQVTGASPGDCSFAWYIDGAVSAAGAGAEHIETLDVGRHSVRLVVTVGGNSYESERKNIVTVYPTDVYCDEASTTAAWPFQTPETAASNLNEVVDTALGYTGTVHLAAGTYNVTKTVSLVGSQRVIGGGRDVTTVRRSPTRSELRIFSLNGEGTYIGRMTIANGNGLFGSGVWISGAGGAVSECTVTNCVGTTNLSGGGMRLESGKALVSRSIITHCRTTQYDYSGCSGGGVEISSGIVENCLIISNSATWAGGVYIYGGFLRNCTVVGNASRQSSEIIHSGGGVYCSGGSVVNCIIRDNIDALSEAAGYSPDAGGLSANFSNCCVPVDVGADCVTEGPGFRNPAEDDFRITSSSPCARAGRYEAWMDGEIDFFGNPRATRSRKADIGYHQSASYGTTFMLR